MATEIPETIDLEAQRAELEAVLGSEHFTRAPTLANLLSYLCEKLFAGESYQIKEYSVGVEVFHRRPSFDQDSDSIVRVEANRLRKRLAAYYANEGAGNRLQITIPLGQYVPQFKSVAAPPGESEAATNPPAVAVPAIESAANPKMEHRLRFSGHRIWWVIGALALLFLGASSAVLFQREMKQAPPAAEPNQSSAPTAESELGRRQARRFVFWPVQPAALWIMRASYGAPMRGLAAARR